MAKPGSFCSHFPSFTPSFLPLLSRALSEVSSLYWMVHKQNHKPISVTLAMRLDGPNLSPSGAIGSTPVSLKRPLSSRQRGSFLFGDNCNWALAVHVTHSNLSPAVRFGAMMACCAHYRQATSSCMAVFVTINQIVHRVPFYEASKWFQKKKHMEELAWFSCAKEMLHNIKATLWC